MDPVPYEDFFQPLEFYDLDSNGAISTDEELYMFPNESVQLRVKQFSAEAGVSFPAVAVSTKGGNYEVFVDYAKYRIDTDAATDITYQSGVGIRIRAQIVTLEADLNISSLFGIAAAANAQQLSGTLWFETMGISGPQISPLIPLPAQLSVESVQAAMQAAAAIKSNLYNPRDVRLYPQVFGYKEPPAEEREAEANEAASVLGQP
jgi:hypothetical protein